jgi:uncharacterized membrane protein YadS
MTACCRWIVLLVALSYGQTLVAQGCSVCGNTAAAAPERQQQQLRKGIVVMLVPTMAIIGAFGIVLYRNRK